MTSVDNEIYKEIDEHGYFVLLPEKWEKFMDRLLKLKKDGVLITCAQIDSTRGYMNDEYYFTYADNRFNLCIKREDRYLEYVAKNEAQSLPFSGRCSCR